MFVNGVAGGAGSPTVGGAVPEARGDGGFDDSKAAKYGKEPNTHTRTLIYFDNFHQMYHQINVIQLLIEEGVLTCTPAHPTH